MTTQRAALPSARLSSLGLTLPAPRQPIANFVAFRRHRDLLFLSGQGPVGADGRRRVGKVGGDVTAEQAYDDARLTTLNLLSAARAALGTIDRVDQVIKVLGFVNAVPEFAAHPQVINGCSDLLVEVFGQEQGRHARSAIGVGSLPGGITVEIEMIVSVLPD